VPLATAQEAACFYALRAAAEGVHAEPTPAETDAR
jgi:hypothetical protein